MSIMLEDPVATRPAGGPPIGGGFRFRAVDVTGYGYLDVDESLIPPQTPVHLASRTLASRFALPPEVPVALRSDTSGEYLRDDSDDITIQGELNRLGTSTVCVTPKTHLGQCTRG